MIPREFKVTITTPEQRLSLLPWVALLPKPHDKGCSHSARRGRLCKNKAKFIYVDLDGSLLMVCTTHADWLLYNERWSLEPGNRLDSWTSSVNLEMTLLPNKGKVKNNEEQEK